MSLVMESEKERFSFSKLSSFHNCKYAYYLTYHRHLKGTTNCFSSYGLLIHSLMERFEKGELDLWNLVDTYEWEFESAVPEEFPSLKYCKDMRKLYYEQGLEYLKQFKGYDGKKILEVEAQFDYDIDDWVFNGIIDLVYEDENGKLVIQDYKSKSAFKNKREQGEYARQLYLYSLYVKKKYGRYPDYLRFAMFRKNTFVDIPFDPKGLEEAIFWAKDTVAQIRECWDYTPHCEEFYGQYLCNHRCYCEHKNSKE